MNCEKFQTVVTDLARDEIMEASDRAKALAHVDSCEPCGEAWSNQRQLSDGLRNLAQQMNTLPIPAAFEEKLLVAFRNRSQSQPLRPAAQRWRYWIGAAAAALLLAFGVLAWRSQMATPTVVKDKPVVAVPNETRTPDQLRTVAVSGPQSSDQSAPPIPVAADHTPRKSERVKRGGGANLQPISGTANGVAANTEQKEIATDFVALGYASELDLQDGGQLLRVELPRSALARFGLPVNMDRADERVKADLLVGADGLARAIRFVK
jgi:hypothetical protein